MDREQGQSLVELGVSFLLLVYLLSGAVEFGIIFFQYVQLRDAAQEGALYGSMFPSDTASIVGRVRGSSQSPIDLYSPDVDISILTNNGEKANTDACEADAITITVQYPHKVFMPFIPTLLGQDVIMLDGRVTNTVLQPVCQGS